jgi:hypothetical protein
MVKKIYHIKIYEKMAMINNNNARENWIEQIYNDYPELKNDALKRHYVEQMVDAYIANEKKFKTMTQEMRKNGLDFKQEPIPNEILAIGRIEAEETPIIVDEIEVST